MYLSALILGVMVTLAGATMLAFGIPINEFGLGNTLIIAGTTAFVGGLILIALSEAVRQLRRIAKGLLARPVGRVPRANELFDPVADAPAAPRIPFPPKPEPRRRAPTPERHPEPRLDIAPSLDARDEPVERTPAFARSNAPDSADVPERDETPLSPKVEPQFSARPEEKDELAEGLLATAFSRLEVSPRPSPAAAEPPRQQDEFESFWPPERKAADAEPVQAEAADQVEAPEAEQPPSSQEQDQAAEPYSVSILKSGVVDGMAYTLY